MWKKRILSLFVCLAICLPLLPKAAFAAETEKTVSTWEEFTAALADTDVTTIHVTGTITSPQPGKDDAFVIGGGSGAVTITGGRITLQYAGIVLNRDVTFRNIEIHVSNPVRNAIIANGHALALENVTNTNSINLFLFCGGITDYCGSNKSEIPNPGDKGHITVSGKNNLGNIYAGSLSDVTDGVADSPNTYAGAAIITLEPGATGIGDIYAHGARENRSGGFPNGMFPDSSLYKVTGGVTVHLSNNTTSVYGSTGGKSDAAVIFTDDGKGNQYSPLLTDISSLTLNAGCNMAPAAGSSFGSGAKVSVPADARLNFSNITSPCIGPLTGGGTLVLGENQTLTIDGAVTGTTKVAVKDVNYDGTASTGTIAENHLYLIAKDAAENSFTLLPSNGWKYVFQKDANGNFTAIKSGTVGDLDVAALQLKDDFPDSGAAEAELSITATDRDGKDISHVLATMEGITVSVNGKDAPYDEDECKYVSDADIMLFISTNDNDNEYCLAVEPTYPTQAIPDGTYMISVTVPGSFTTSGQNITATARLTVGGKRITGDMVSLSETVFTYNGNPQKPTIRVSDGSTSLAENTDYTVSYLRDGEKTSDLTSAGTITVAVAGAGNYVDTAEKSYTIQKAAAPTITWPTAQSLTYGQTLADSSLTGGSTNYGSFSWKASDTVPTAGDNAYPMVFAPSEDILNNYEPIADTENTIAVHVDKAVPAVRLSASVAEDGKVTLKAVFSRAGSSSFPVGTVQFADITDSGNPQNIDSPVQIGADGTASLIWNAPEKKEYTIRASYGGDTNYETGTAEENIDTSKRSQAELIITSETTVPYGQTLTLSTRGGSTNKTVTYTVSPSDGATISGNILTPSRVGEVTVTASMAGDDSYLDVTSEPVTIRITKGTGIGSVTMADWTYGETASEPVPASDTNGIDNVSYSYKQKGANDASYTADKPVNAGEYTVKAVFAATANYTEAVATADFTIHEKNTSGGDLPETPEEPVKIPVSGGNSVNIEVTVEDTAATLGELTPEEAAALIDGTTSMVKIDLSALSQTIDRVNLPFAAIEALTEAAGKTDTEESLAIVLSTGTVTLDEKTMQAVVEQDQGSEIQLVLDNAGADNLTNVQKEAIKDMKIYGAVEAYIICTQSKERISDFKGGVATLEIPFAVPEGLESSGFAVWYVDEDGGKTRLNSNCENDRIVWDVGHFSDFVIAYTDTDDSRPGDSNTNTSGGSNNNDDKTTGSNKTVTASPKTGDDENLLLYMIMLIVSAGLIGFVVISKTYAEK